MIVDVRVERFRLIGCVGAEVQIRYMWANPLCAKGLGTTDDGFTYSGMKRPGPYVRIPFPRSSTQRSW